MSPGQTEIGPSIEHNTFLLLPGCSDTARHSTDRRVMPLVLTRKIGESISIGPEISVRLIEIQGRQVRLLITAPRGINVDREEVAIRAGRPHVESIFTEPETEMRDQTYERMKHLAALLRVCNSVFTEYDLFRANLLRLSVDAWLAENQA